MGTPSSAGAYVNMNRKRQFARLASPFNHARNAHAAERLAALVETKPPTGGQKFDCRSDHAKDWDGPFGHSVDLNLARLSNDLRLVKVYQAISRSIE